MPLVFDRGIAKGKPENIRHREGYCPFCDVDGLTDIIRREDDRIWLVNKYRTLRDTMQTVVIESADHDGDPSNYDIETNRRVFRFAIRCWDEMIRSGKYESVLMYKNYGPLSGGTLLHPHLQIVGLEHEDGYAGLTPQNFGGMAVWEEGRARVEIATSPVMGFFELDISVPEGVAASRDAADEADANRFIDAVRTCVRYVLNEHHDGRCTSYNLFFYRFVGRTICKVVPRWVVSHYFVGYRLAQINSPESLADDAAALARRFAR